MEYECYFVDCCDQLELGFAAITVLIDYSVQAECAPSWKDPGCPTEIKIESVALRQIENDDGTINYDALSPDKQKQVDDWIMYSVNNDGIAQIEDHESYLIDDEGAYSDEG